MKIAPLFLFLMLCLGIGHSVKHEHLFKKQGLVAGVTSYGHLTFDIDLSAVDTDLRNAESIAELFKKTKKDPSVESEVRRVAASIYQSLSRNIRQTQREWDNLRWSLETPVEVGGRVTRFIEIGRAHV